MAICRLYHDLHNANVIHRDPRLPNVLLTTDGDQDRRYKEAYGFAPQSLSSEGGIWRLIDFEDAEDMTHWEPWQREEAIADERSKVEHMLGLRDGRVWRYAV